MEYGFRRPVAIAVGADGRTYRMPVSGLPNYGSAEPYRGLLSTVGRLLVELPNILYMSYGAQRTSSKAKEKRGWVDRNPKHNKQNDHKKGTTKKGKK